MQDIINRFLEIYMYELEVFLNKNKEELKSVSFQSDEANTDRPLKEYLKVKIENSFNKIPENVNLTPIEHKTTLNNIIISKVLLPEEITEDIKSIIRSNKISVYTNPDMCLCLSINNHLYYETIELKSTKQDSIPGSSIQQILPTEWVIFIKHNNLNIEVTTGQYIHAINSKMQFPDRSPRPQVSFKEMKNWNIHNRLIIDNTIRYNSDDEDSLKYKLISDWQHVLSLRWIEMLFNSTIVKTNEPWFNNNMRKFILLFLQRYEELSDYEKIIFKKNIESLIKPE